MKRFIGLFVATIAATTLAVPAAGAAEAEEPAPEPKEYQAACDQLYNAGKAIFDALIANAKPVIQPLEKGFCGDNKYAK